MIVLSRVHADLEGALDGVISHLDVGLIDGHGTLRQARCLERSDRGLHNP